MAPPLRTLLVCPAGQLQAYDCPPAAHTWAFSPRMKVSPQPVNSCNHLLQNLSCACIEGTGLQDHRRLSTA